MYKLYLMLFFSLLCMACSETYCIEGSTTMSNADGKKFFIKVFSNDRWVKTDSSEVVHGAFKMKGVVDSAVIASLFLGDNCLMPLVLERGKITINIDKTGICIKGTPLNDCFNAFVRQKNSLDDRADEVERMEARMIMDGQDPAVIREKMEKSRKELSQEIDGLVKSFIQDNYENVLGTGMFLMIGHSYPYPVLTPLLEDVVEHAPDRFKNNPLVKQYVSAARDNMHRSSMND